MAKLTDATDYLAAVSAGTIGANLDQTVFDGEVSWRRVPGDTSHPIYPGWVPDGPADPRHYSAASSDRVELVDGAMTSGSATLTSASAGFTEDDVGRSIIVYGAGTRGISGTTLISDIASYVSATEVTLEDAAAATVSGASAVVFTGYADRIVEWAAASGVKQGLRAGTVDLETRNSPIRFEDDTVTDFAGMKLRQMFDITSDSGIAVLDPGAKVVGFHYEVDTDLQYERALALTADAVLEDAKIVFLTEKPSVDDNYDAAVSLNGPRVRIKGLTIDGAFKAIDFYSPGATDTSYARIEDVHLYRYAKGISLTAAAVGSIIDGVYIWSLSSHADLEPGDNVITGGAANMVIRNVFQMFEGRGSGEHFLYLSVADGTEGMLVENIYSKGSGQTFLKMRGHYRPALINCHGKYSSADNASGTNEDGFRMEYCRNVFGKDLSMRVGAETLPAQFAGYNGFTLAHCWNSVFHDVYLDLPNNAYIHLSTSAAPVAGYSTSPNDACEELYWHNLVARRPSSVGSVRPLVMLSGDTDVKIGNIEITGLTYDGTVGQLVVAEAGTATVTQVPGTSMLIDGSVSGRRITYEWAEGSAPTIFYHNPRDLTDTVANLTALTTAASPGLGEAVVPVGQRAFATDATATTFASAAVGGDENTVPVWWDGADWIIG